MSEDEAPQPERTGRGFTRLVFHDYSGTACSLQTSSAAEGDCLWLGCNEIGLKRFVPFHGWEDITLEHNPPYGAVHVANNRMHLSREQIAWLLPYLQHFVATGDLTAPEAGG